MPTLLEERPVARPAPEVVVRVETAPTSHRGGGRRGGRGLLTTLGFGAIALAIVLVAGTLTGLINIGNPFASTTTDQSPPVLLKKLTNLAEVRSRSGDVRVACRAVERRLVPPVVSRRIECRLRRHRHGRGHGRLLEARHRRGSRQLRQLGDHHAAASQAPARRRRPGAQSRREPRPRPHPAHREHVQGQPDERARPLPPRGQEDGQGCSREQPHGSRRAEHDQDAQGALSDGSASRRSGCCSRTAPFGRRPGTATAFSSAQRVGLSRGVAQPDVCSISATSSATTRSSSRVVAPGWRSARTRATST